MQSSPARVFYILHFNDVYDIEQQQKEPKGGASRFVRVANALQNHYGNQLLTLFSGDIFAPSQLSTIYKVDVACLGNHDFDYNLEELRELMKQSNTTWVLSNVVNVDTQRPLADADPVAFRDLQLGGERFRICFLGLAEEEWLGQITEIPQRVMLYEDFSTSSNRIIECEKKTKNIDMVIALTHMRIPNDLQLIEQNKHINLVLGGHDHIWFTQQQLQAFYLKSGTNFRNLGLLRVTVGDELNPGKLQDWEKEVEDILKGLSVQKTNGFFERSEHHQIAGFGIDFIGINITSDLIPDEEIEAFVEDKIEVYNMGKCAYYIKSTVETLKTIGFTDVELETRFKKVRYEETNMLNFYTDLIRAEYETEVAIINSGMIRADELLSNGTITYQTINKIFAIPDLLVSYKSSGKRLHETLENGQENSDNQQFYRVSKWPAFDGRFLAVSGITFKFDPKKPAGQRIAKEDILVNGEVVNYERVYSTVTKNYVATGYDGFLRVNKEDFIIDETLGKPCIQLVNEFFEMARKCQSIKRLSIGSEEEMKEQIGFVRKFSNEQILGVIQPENYHDERYQKFHHIIKEVRIIDNEPFVVISPRVEGRIQIKQ